MTRDDNITWGETVDELDRLRAELAEARKEPEQIVAWLEAEVAAIAAWNTPALLDELDRLRAELSEERHAHNKTQFDLAKREAGTAALSKRVEELEAALREAHYALLSARAFILEKLGTKNRQREDAIAAVEAALGGQHD